MLLYYIKLAWRNLVWNKTFSAINIVGLSIGLTSCLIIGFYVYTELSFDQFHRNHEQIFRIFVDATVPVALREEQSIECKNHQLFIPQPVVGCGVKLRINDCTVLVLYE